jgi:hypothetical protein
MRARAVTPSTAGPAVAAALAFTGAASLAGLLWIPMDLYDEPALAVGGRIVRAGGLPYLDFYTHYGPLGYSLMALFLGLGNPGIAYRLAQASALAAVAVPLYFVARRISSTRAVAAALISLVLLAFSAAIVSTHFFGFALAVLALELLALGELAIEPRSRDRLWLAAGAAAGLSGLVRPAFAVYSAAAVLGFVLATSRSPGCARRLARFCLGAVVVAGLAWLLLYRAIPPADAWFATIVLPARLTGGAARFLSSALLPPSVGASPQKIFGSLHLAVLFLLVTLAALRSPERRARVASVAGAVIAAATPSLLASASAPGTIAGLIAAALLASAVLSYYFASPSLSSAALRISALAGLASVAFLHYAMARGDQAHVTAALALAVAAAAAVLPALTHRGLAGAIALLAVAILPTLIGAPPYPAYWIGREPGSAWASTATGLASRFPASRFPADAVAAARRADGDASPSSRFVALATDHSRTEGSAIVLFLLSSRLPYTRWYAYDPGVQSTPFVQRQMEDELRRSGSATAVTWKSESFAGAPEADPPRTELDRELRRLYPRVAERFGILEVRENR